MDILRKIKKYSFKVRNRQVDLMIIPDNSESLSMLESIKEYEYRYYIDGQIEGWGFSEEDYEDLIDTIRGEVNIYNGSISKTNDDFIEHSFRENTIPMSFEEKNALRRERYQRRKEKALELKQKEKDALDANEELEQDTDYWLKNTFDSDGKIEEELSMDANNLAHSLHEKESLDIDIALEKESDLWLQLSAEDKEYTDELTIDIDNTYQRKYNWISMKSFIKKRELWLQNNRWRKI